MLVFRAERVSGKRAMRNLINFPSELFEVFFLNGKYLLKKRLYLYKKYIGTLIELLS